MKFQTRKWVKPQDLNPNGTLFGGLLLAWIDEEAALYAAIQLDNTKVVTKFISEINFMSSAKQGDIIEIGMQIVNLGTTSLTLKCEARNIMTKAPILTVDNIVMINLDAQGKPSPHGKTEIKFKDDRLI